MNLQSPVIDYSIRDIIKYRALYWLESEDFFYLTQIPDKFEPFLVKPNYYCFGMITQGSLEININNTYHNVSRDSLMVYRPGQVFKVTRIAENTKGTFVLFTKKFLNYLNENIFSVKKNSFLSQGVSSVFQLSINDHHKILSAFKEIFALLRHCSKTNWELIARNLTSALIYETDTILSSYFNTNEIASVQEDDLFNRFNNLISDHFKKSKKLAFYTSKLCVSADCLYATVKKVTGKPPMALINHHVILEAKYLVIHTVKTCSEIAYYLNFSDPFAFSKYFKRHTGLSPLQYRKQNGVLASLPEN